MADTVAGLFPTRAAAEEALRKLKEAGFPAERIAVSSPRRRRRGRYGAKLLAGLAIGTLLGAIVGAVASGIVPGVRPLMAGNVLVTFALAAVAGAATGLVAGGLLSMSASGDRALYYEQEVESGRVLVSVWKPGLENARAILLAAGAMEAAPIEAPMMEERRKHPRAEGG